MKNKKIIKITSFIMICVILISISIYIGQGSNSIDIDENNENYELIVFNKSIDIQHTVEFNSLNIIYDIYNYNYRIIFYDVNNSFYDCNITSHGDMYTRKLNLQFDDNESISSLIMINGNNNFNISEIEFELYDFYKDNNNVIIDILFSFKRDSTIVNVENTEEIFSSKEINIDEDIVYTNLNNYINFKINEFYTFNFTFEKNELYLFICSIDEYNLRILEDGNIFYSKDIKNNQISYIENYGNILFFNETKNLEIRLYGSDLQGFKELFISKLTYLNDIKSTDEIKLNLGLDKKIQCAYLNIYDVEKYETLNSDNKLKIMFFNESSIFDIESNLNNITFSGYYFIYEYIEYNVMIDVCSEYFELYKLINETEEVNEIEEVNNPFDSIDGYNNIILIISPMILIIFIIGGKKFEKNI